MKLIVPESLTRVVVDEAEYFPDPETREIDVENPDHIKVLQYPSFGCTPAPGEA